MKVIIVPKVCVALALADPQPEAQGVQGGQGYNPGPSGGQGYNPGGGGGQGYNPGGEGGQGYNPGGDGGQGYNPGGQPYLPLDPSQQGYNPGINYLPLDLNQQGYNPGSSNFLPLDPSQHPGGPNIQPLDPIQQGGSSGMFNPNARPLGPSPPSGQPGQCGMVDECCGMAQQGCCVEGQQCYTYYTQECESVDAPVCNKRLRNLCHEATVPDCQVRRNPGSLVKTTQPNFPYPPRFRCSASWSVCLLQGLRCSPTTSQSAIVLTQPQSTGINNGQVFPISFLRYKVVTWENEELKEVNSTFNQEIKNITTCEFSYINKTVVENVPKVSGKRKRIENSLF